ncbi:MAG: purine-nucleoside phosphorylase [Planctomycetaceae bacterium]|nr:purine-nucleoside phosphorylase [Planctomycetaceae bacterium]
MQGIFDQTAQAVKFIQEKWAKEPQLGLICGTGLGDLVKQIDTDVVIPYDEIPHFPTSTVQSHAGQLVCGELRGVPVMVMEGRFHFYEGYTMQQVTFPVRVMRGLGVETLIVTNAAGGINPQLHLADILIIEDHINLLPDNPLRGVNDDRLGPRFPDMSAPYDRELIDLTRQTALEMQIPATPGVFVAVMGPNLETRAEYRMLKTMGADVVGMSTVPEVLVANHAGMRVLAFSVVTDLCLPDALEPVAIEKIIAVAAQGGERLAQLIPQIVEKL